MTVRLLFDVSSTYHPFSTYPEPLSTTLKLGGSRMGRGKIHNRVDCGRDLGFGAEG